MLLTILAGLSLAGVCNSASTTWKEEFERICRQTQTASSLSAEQLQQLVDASDTLLEQLAHIGNPQGKVYVFRLENCRNFFVYLLHLNTLDEEGSAQ